MSARSALEFLCEKYRRRKFASDAIEWAVAELMEGNDSDSLRRLAATVKPTDWWEVEPLLQASFAELGYAWPDEEDCYFACVDATARDIVEDRVSPREGCARILKLAGWLWFQEGLSAWEYLSDNRDPRDRRQLSADEFTSTVRATAAAWLRTRQRAPK